MAMFVANLAPIFLAASAANMSAEQSATIIQAGLLVAGLGTCLQLYGVWLIGSRLPMVTGISFTYVAAAMSISQNQGDGAVAGAVVLGGLLEVVPGWTAKVLALLRAADRIRNRGYVDWFFAALRWCHQFRRRFRR